MIYRSFCCLLILYVLSNHDAHAQIIPVSCEVNGEVLWLEFDREKVASTPAWNPNDNDEPPISLHSAFKLAKQRLVQMYPAKRDTEWHISVRLNSVCVDPMAMSAKEIQYPPTLRWIYTVSFENTFYAPSPKRTKLSNEQETIDFINHARSTDIKIAVLMDGSVVHPVPVKSNESFNAPSAAPKSR